MKSSRIGKFRSRQRSKELRFIPMPNHHSHSSGRFIHFSVLILTAAAIFLVPNRVGITASQEDDSRPPTTTDGSTSSQSPHQEDNPAIQAPPQMIRKMRKERMKDDFKQMKKDSAALTELAQSLQQELDKSNEHILSLGVVDKADKIEKLARKIKLTAKGF